MAAFQIVIGFRRVQNTAAAGIDHHQLARTDAAFLDHFVRLVIPDPHFRGAGDELVFGDDVARRTQTVTVQLQAAKRPSDITIPAGPSHGSMCMELKSKNARSSGSISGLFCQPAARADAWRARYPSRPPAAAPACCPWSWSQSRFRSRTARHRAGQGSAGSGTYRYEHAPTGGCR